MNQLPNDLNAEAGLLSCFLNDPINAISAFTKVKESDFFSRQHKIIYRAMRNLFDSKTDIDLITLQSELKRLDKMDKVGGVPYLVNLSEIVMTASNVRSYLNTVLELSKKRHVVASIENASQMIKDGVAYADIRDMLIHSAIDHDGLDSKTVCLADVVSNIISNYDNDEELKRSFPTRLGFLNRLVFSEGKLVVLAARPAMGKSALATQMAIDWGLQGFSVLIFSLEMDETEVGVRIVSQMSCVDGRDIMSKQLNEDQTSLVMTASEKLIELPISINDESFLTIPVVQGVVMRYKLEHGNPDIMVFDYLQLMTGKGENKVQIVTEISRQLKILARMFKCCVVALSQLNRGLENREDKRPRLSDLRESGAIEQDADIVGFLYREIVYNESADPNSAEFIVRKNRQGETYIQSCTFLPYCTRFGDI